MPDRRVQNVPWMNRAPGSNWTHARPEEPQQQMPLSTRQFQQNIAERQLGIQERQMDLREMREMRDMFLQQQAESDTREQLRQELEFSKTLSTLRPNDPAFAEKFADIEAQFPLADTKSERIQRWLKWRDDARTTEMRKAEMAEANRMKFIEKYGPDAYVEGDWDASYKKVRELAAQRQKQALENPPEGMVPVSAVDSETGVRYAAPNEPRGLMYDNVEEARKAHPGGWFKYDSQGRVIVTNERPAQRQTETFEIGPNGEKVPVRGSTSTVGHQAPAPPPPPAAAPVTVAATAKDKYPRAASVEEFEALKSGVTFIGPDGRRYRKP